MSTKQIIGLCVGMVFLGMFLCLLIMVLIAVIYDYFDRKKKIVRYLKTNSTGKIPYMLFYKYLTYEEKKDILEKVGNK